MQNSRKKSKLNRNKLSYSVAGSLLVHGLVGVSIWNVLPDKIVVEEAQPVFMVELVAPEIPPPEPDPAPTGPPSEVPAPQQAVRTEEAAKAPTVTPKPQTAPPPPIHRTPPPKIPTETVAITSGPPSPDFRLLGAGEMAGALVAGSGAGGGAGQGSSGGGGSGGTGTGKACNMAGRLQAMVRRDARVQAAVGEAQARLQADGRAMVMWDGDWVQSQGQEGRGLAVVRQAIAVEVAFAPRECRMEQVRGMVVLSLSDAPSAPRLALGVDNWRWGDLALR